MQYLTGMAQESSSEVVITAISSKRRIADIPVRVFIHENFGIIISSFCIGSVPPVISALLYAD
jgi:hypothetical protein